VTRNIEPVPTTRSRRSSPALPDDELRLPHPPGVIRQFWARHPRFADVLIALLCLALTLTPALTFTAGSTTDTGSDVVLSPSPAPTAFASLSAIVACVLLLWRRRLPVVVFVASLVVAVSYLTLPLPSGGPLLLVTAYTLAVYRSSRACWIGLATGIGALTVLSLGLAIQGTVQWNIVLNAIAGQAVVGLIGALIGVNVGNRKRYIEAVLARSRQLLVERDQQAELAAATERARIAREMHDIVSHSLTVIVALSEGALATPDPERARFAMDATADTARAALTEMRGMLGVLREGGPTAPLTPTEPVSPASTIAAAQRAGFPATLTVSGERDVPQPVTFAIGRIVQEGLTNAMRHAPAASFIAARIEYTESDVIVTVCNDGVSGIPRSDTGFGILGLSERAAHVGGVVTSQATAGGQWMLHATLPIAPPVPVDAPAQEETA
jgi:signal transduction histidine kinase